MTRGRRQFAGGLVLSAARFRGIQAVLKCRQNIFHGKVFDSA